MRKRKKRRAVFRQIRVFAATLLIVTGIGLIVILLMKLFQKQDETVSIINEIPAVSLPYEEIPEGGGEEPGEEKEEAREGKYTRMLETSEFPAHEKIYEVHPANEGEISLMFAGDILFDDEYAIMARALQRGGTPEASFSPELLQKMGSADIMMVNNEFPYTNRGEPVEEKQFTFRGDPDKVSWLFDMGVDIISLANNHAYDFGEIGLLDTLDTLEQVGMPYIGAGRNIEEAIRPAYFMSEDIKVGIIAATQIERLDNPDTRGATETEPGVFRCFNPQRLYQVVEEARKNCDFLIVFIHWGTENTTELDWAQLDQAPKIVEAGADLVIGAHPHCLQAIAYYEDVPVVFSLGNFLFNSKTLDTGMIEAVVDESGLKSLQFHPALQEDCRSVLLEGSEKERVLNVMRELSEGVHIDEDGMITK